MIKFLLRNRFFILINNEVANPIWPEGHAYHAISQGGNDKLKVVSLHLFSKQIMRESSRKIINYKILKKN